MGTGQHRWGHFGSVAERALLTMILLMSGIIVNALAAPTGLDTKACTTCGTVLPEPAKFCYRCGARQPELSKK